MKLNSFETNNAKTKTSILALHSSSETLGVATLDYLNPKQTIKSSTFPIGKQLSNNLLTCIQELVPKEQWSSICRLGVATGPGGFTGTRLTVVLARTLAQQLNCPLDGVSSFELMAPRLALKLKASERNSPFWIIKKLPRRGDIGGKYQISKQSKNCQFIRVSEIEVPHLLDPQSKLRPAVQAEEDVMEDVIRLLNYSLDCLTREKKGNWENILPIYPTSPVGTI